LISKISHGPVNLDPRQKPSLSLLMITMQKRYLAFSN
jgi:hypothetical protein